MRMATFVLDRGARGFRALMLAFTFGAVALNANQVRAAEELIDTKAMKILGQMSQYLGGAGSFSAKATSLFDDVRPSGIKIKSSAVREIFVRRPAELHAHTQFDEGAGRSFWYDGNELVIHADQSNEYAKLEFAGTIDELLDHVIENTEVRMPLADLLYSDIKKTFDEDIISAEYVGERLVDEVLCHQLSIESTGADWQIWIEADDTPVPRRFSIDYVHVEGAPQYIASFTEWQVDRQLEDADIAVEMDPNAMEVSLDQLLQ